MVKLLASKFENALPSRPKIRLPKDEYKQAGVALQIRTFIIQIAGEVLPMCLFIYVWEMSEVCTILFKCCGSDLWGSEMIL